MKVSLSWLREFAPIEGEPDDVADQLTALGMELESVTRVGSGLGGVVVARVLDVREHPDADRIRLVDVDPGDGSSLQICCGASNMAAGDLVPLATVGTVMPNGLEIAERRMRGQMSSGMLCSARELELGDDHAGILILPPDLAPGVPVTEALGLSEDVVYDFDALPNRPDTLSILGVARDLAAHQRVPFRLPDPQPDTHGAGASELCSVQIDAPELCGHFHLRVLSGVELGQSPRWLAQRLIASGMRPINNVVDVSNYVMLELGQPNHAYDLATVPGGALRVRWGRAGERLRTLDGVDRALSPEDGVIADGEDRPVGLAGVMGGASTEISDTTTDVLLELAWWNPGVIAATSARLNLHSEASLRYKRGVDPELAPLAAGRFVELLSKISAARAHPGTVVQRGDLPAREVVHVRTSKVNGLLGTELHRDEVAALLEPIGFDTNPVGDDLEVTVPSWRPDSSIEADVIEEVARHHGYSRIPRAVPVSPHTGELTVAQRGRRVLRRTLMANGLDEAMPMPFLAPGDLERCGLPSDGLKLANPLAAEESVLRTSLLPGLLEAVAYNASHRNNGVHLFELGRVFSLGDRGVITDVSESVRVERVLAGEREHLAAVLAGQEAGAAVELAEVLLGAVGRSVRTLRADEIPGLHPGRSAWIVIEGADSEEVVVGQVGEVDPRVLESHDIDERVAWVQLDLTTLAAQPVEVPTARPVSRLPSTDFDLAFVVDEQLPAASVAATIRSAGGPLLAAVELFDVFRAEQIGASKRSLAFRLRLQAHDRTLTDAEVARIRGSIISAAEEAHGAILRG